MAKRSKKKKSKKEVKNFLKKENLIVKRKNL